MLDTSKLFIGGFWHTVHRANKIAIPIRNIIHGITIARISPVDSPLLIFLRGLSSVLFVLFLSSNISVKLSVVISDERFI